MMQRCAQSKKEIRYGGKSKTIMWVTPTHRSRERLMLHFLFSPPVHTDKRVLSQARIYDLDVQHKWRSIMLNSAMHRETMSEWDSTAGTVETAISS